MRFAWRAVAAILIAFVTTAAVAQMNGGRHGRGGMPDVSMQPTDDMGMSAIVIAPDGLVLVPQRTETATAQTFALMAIGPDGAKRWSWSGAGGPRWLDVFGTVVVVVDGTMGDATRAPGMTSRGTSEVVALSLVSGSVQWRLPLDGPVISMETTSERMYVVVRRQATADRALTAIDAGGRILWTIPLN